MSYLLPLLLSLAACLALQSLALRAAGGRTTKSESNYHSSLARIQNAVRDAPDVMLLGSSRIGRLPEWSGTERTIGNLGCDGGSAAITLRAIDRGRLPRAPVIVVEGNTLLHDLEKRGWQISEAIGSPWFRLGQAVPNLSATARPAAFAYSALLGRGRTGSTAAEGELLRAHLAPAPPDPAAFLPETAEGLVTELAAIIWRLRSDGSKVMLVMLPPAAPPDRLNSTIPAELARTANVPLLDLTQDLAPGEVTYTDGVHMAPASAAAALRTILNAVDNLQ